MQVRPGLHDRITARPLAALMLLSLLGMPVPAVARSGPAADPGPAADQTIAALDALLLRASDADHARLIATRLEARRMARLSPTTRLMLSRGQRELAGGQRREAVEDMSDAIELQPDQGPLWRERAAAQAMQGDLDAAVTDLGGALSRDPTDILSWTALSEIEEHRSQPRQAYEAWERVLQLDPMIAGGAARLVHLHRAMLGEPT